MINPFIIPVVFFVAIVTTCLCLRGKRSPEAIQGVATLLGIFGTFLGIVWGLSGIDFNNLDASISNLLDGIYPAFISSLTGVLMSLLVYFSPKFWKQKEEHIDSEPDTDSQILLELRNLNKNISGDSETSLSTQLLKLKTGVMDKQDELKKSFDEFAEKMADNNMRALEEVIRDFNEKLQEQFGENFKELNKAVGALLDWQENYKDTVEKTNVEMQDMLKTLESSKESMDISSRSLEEITKSARSFKENADALKAQLDETRGAIGTINEFSKNLDGAASTIKSNMDELMTKTLEDLGQNLKGVSEALVNDYRELQRVINEMRNTQ